MADTAQKRAVRNYRARMMQQGISRFEVLGLDADRELIRTLARRLVENGPDAARIRAVVDQVNSEKPRATGRILAALRRSPLVGMDIEFKRASESGRKVDI